MNNVENKNSPKMIIGFIFGLFAGVIGVLFAQYVFGVDEPEKNSINQQSEKALNDSNQLSKASRLSIANTGPEKNTLPEKSKEENDEEKSNDFWETIMALGENKQKAEVSDEVDKLAERLTLTANQKSKLQELLEAKSKNSVRSWLTVVNWKGYDC